MTASAEIDLAMRDVISGHLGDLRVVSVDIRSDMDAEGDPILRIRVVYDPASGKFDPDRASDVLRRLLSRLDELGEQSFPLVSFVTESDARNLNSEAA